MSTLALGGVINSPDQFWKGPYRIGGGDTVWVSRDNRWSMTRWADWRLVDLATHDVFRYDSFDEMIEDLVWWYTRPYQARITWEPVL